MWDCYHTVANIEDALKILDKEKGHSKIIAGGTDLVLEIKKKMHPHCRVLIDINRVKGLDKIWEEEDYIHIGPTVTHNQCIVSKLLVDYAIPLVKASQSIGAAQIRNIGTIYGNLITASPANDTILPLIAMNAEIQIQSMLNKRWVKLSDFYKGVRKTVLKEDEIVTDLRFIKLKPNQRASFQKYLLRNTHGISVANATVILGFGNETINEAIITLGAVSPVIIHAEEAEKYLIGKKLNAEIIKEASSQAIRSASPIDDVRATQKYRNHLIPILVERALNEIFSDQWKNYTDDPVLLWGKNSYRNKPINETISHTKDFEIITVVNKRSYKIKKGQNGTLLNFIREIIGLTGTKLGCGEGECGACTLHFNGVPVLSCLIPAPRAHEAEITTIEGMAVEGKLHPVQQAFIDEGAVQCGYCTPGFIMSAVKLLEEKPKPTREQIMEGLAGNICRCTGYYSIINAVERAANNLLE